MRVHVGSTTVVAPGNKVMVLPSGFKVHGVHFQIAHQNDVGSEFSSGLSNGIVQRSGTAFSRDQMFRTRRSTSEGITHYRAVNGVFTKILGGGVTPGGFDTAGFMGLTFTVCTQPTTIDYMVFGE